MRKRILSLLLALTLVLSAGVFGVIPALAADSCVSVKADAVTTGEVVAGSLLEIKLADVFEDTDGHTLTYTLTNAAQFSVQTKVKDGSLYVSEKDPGTYEPKVKATCSDGKELTATFTITVKEAPHGLDAQYNYDETPAKEVTVYVTISNDGVPIRGKDGTILCHKAITVPYFDLSRYDMPEFYRFHTANGEGEYVDENIVERPTGLHLYLYLLERYFIGLPEEECGKGKYTRSDLEGFILRDDVLYMDEETAYTADTLAALKITGSPTSLYMANFWGHDENLMYYRNHCYPYMSPGWGSTSDYILLSNGDTWDVAMYSNWSFWSSGGAFTCFDQDEYSVRPGTQMTVNTRAGYSLEVDGGFGEKTRAALMDYQRRAGMTPDGVAGSKTWASLGLQSAQDRLADLEKGYTPSRETQEARRSWEELAARQPGDYTSPYADRMEDLLRQMESREAFSYDPSRDEMFRRYARLYQRQGQTAMEDTLGQAAGLTGGYDSSYARQAGQQEYNRYMQELAALVPQLQQDAWDRYEIQGQALLDQYKLLQGQDEDAYGQWRDRVEDWQDASRQARDRYESLEKQDYSNYLALMKYYASRAKQEQDAALAQQKLEASAARSGSARSSSGGSRKASLSSTASESLERTMNTYLSQGDTGRVKQLFLQYRDRMTPLQKRRFEKLMGKYNIPMTE